MPTVWGFVAVLRLGVVIGAVYKIRRRYYGNAPIRPVFERACGGKNATFREKYIIRYGKLTKGKTRMNARNYYSIFKHEPDILTVPDVVRLLRMGKNTVYKLIKEGSINSIKQGKKIIIPKVCLIKSFCGCET